MMTMVAVALLTGMASCAKEEENTPSEPTCLAEAFDADGATVALFSVSPSKQVRFSRGNLQFQAVTGIWRFAEHQYDMLGEANSYISADNGGWIDLFGWGTSGWESGAVAWQPWSYSTDDADYRPGGDYRNSLTGDYANADWGVYNAIENGGNRVGMWRTLTSVEWHYLLFERSGKRTKATVCDVPGMVVLPDEWTQPEGIGFTVSDMGFVNNVYTAEQWARMESAGAVFLPAAGFRYALWADYVGEWGAYWSSSWYNENAALSCVFSSDTQHPSDGEHRFYGMSVRLVKDK